MIKNLRSSSKPVWTIFSIFLFLVEYYFFYKYAHHELIIAYPRNFDQGVYLSHAYKLYVDIANYGIIKGLAKTPLLSTGMFFPLQAGIFFWLFSASRYHALLINFVYFIILQIAVIFAAKKIFKKLYLVLILLGFILMAGTPYFPQGGLFDFRMDFIAFCLYGTFITLIVGSEIFLNKHWNIAIIFTVILLLLTRSLTVVYIAPVLIAIFVYLIIKLRGTVSHSGPYAVTKTRSSNLLICASIIVLITLPFLLLNSKGIYHYYYDNHIASSEKYIREAEVGIRTTFSAFIYYPQSLFEDHLGRKIIHFSLISLVIVVMLRLRYQRLDARKDQAQVTNNISFLKEDYIFLGASTLIPLLALTSDPSKSPVVAGIVTIPSIWLIVLTIKYLISEAMYQQKIVKLILNCLAILIFTVGVNNLINNFNHTSCPPYQQDMAQITKMYTDIGDYSINKNWQQINLSVDQIVDYLTVDDLVTIYFERRGKYLNAAIKIMGGKIFAITQSEVINSLKQSNVVIINLNNYQNDSLYPFNHSINQYHLFIKQYLDKKFKTLGDYHFMASTYRVYVLAN